ncbi:unnamed protein product, partial [Ectocarpus sp. 13 AM-2016]
MFSPSQAGRCVGKCWCLGHFFTPCGQKLRPFSPLMPRDNARAVGEGGQSRDPLVVTATDRRVNTLRSPYVPTGPVHVRGMCAGHRAFTGLPIVLIVRFQAESDVDAPRP